MFWSKKRQHSKPSAINGPIGRLIAAELSKVRLAGDHWVKYLMISRPHPDDQQVCDVRIFDEWCANQQKVKVIDFSSLDDHQDLILMEGWYDERSGKGDIKARLAA